MARYIKQEMSDLNGTGEKRVFYRMKIERNIDMKDFTERIAYPGSGLSRASVMHVMTSVADCLARYMAEGCSARQLRRNSTAFVLPSMSSSSWRSSSVGSHPRTVMSTSPSSRSRSMKSSCCAAKSTTSYFDILAIMTRTPPRPAVAWF